jgi:hypothetical protein
MSWFYRRGVELNDSNTVLICDKSNGAIDILKFVMAILVVGIHTEPFGFNIWLDWGFGLVTRVY